MKRKAKSFLLRTLITAGVVIVNEFFPDAFTNNKNAIAENHCNQ